MRRGAGKPVTLQYACLLFISVMVWLTCIYLAVVANMALDMLRNRLPLPPGRGSLPSAGPAQPAQTDGPEASGVTLKPDASPPNPVRRDVSALFRAENEWRRQNNYPPLQYIPDRLNGEAYAEFNPPEVVMPHE